MRVDGDGATNMLAFDNMENRHTSGPLRRTTDWEHRAIVLDVPGGAKSIHYGFYLRGSGAGYAANFKLDIVSEEVELTVEKGNFLQKPTNLNFTEYAGKVIGK